MDIETFYDEDPRRRSSAEIELGRDWRDAGDVRYELSWVEDTGELYVMREPVPRGWGDLFGGVHVRGVHETDETEVKGMVVRVVASIPTREELERVLDGWEAAMEQKNGVAWLTARLRQEGVLLAATPPPAPAPMTQPTA